MRSGNGQNHVIAMRTVAVAMHDCDCCCIAVECQDSLRFWLEVNVSVWKDREWGRGSMVGSKVDVKGLLGATRRSTRTSRR